MAFEFRHGRDDAINVRDGNGKLVARLYWDPEQHGVKIISEKPVATSFAKGLKKGTFGLLVQIGKP